MVDVIKYKDSAIEGYYSQKEIVLKVNELVMMFNSLYYALAVEGGENVLAAEVDAKLKEQEIEMAKFTQESDDEEE